MGLVLRCQIIAVDEAKQFYPLFGLGANVALIFSGQCVLYFSELRERLPPGVDGWGVSLKGMMGVVVGFGACIIATYYYLNRTIVPKIEAAKLAGQIQMGGKKKKKSKVRRHSDPCFTEPVFPFYRHPLVIPFKAATDRPHYLMKRSVRERRGRTTR
jgi:AAA family ATP:ADP antiporter